MTERAQRGRPPLPKGQVCEHRVVTFLNDGVRQRVSDLANRDGKSISQTCRDLITSAIDSIDTQEKHGNTDRRENSDT